MLSGLAVNAQNPIIQTSYTADPAPMVYNDKLYLYTSHDEDGSTWFTMNDWKLYSTDDMVNWTEHPTLLSFKTFEWAGGDAWAAQCIERDGKFYMYVPVTDRKGETAIGVAVADSPYGPFYDPIGAPLVRADYGNIDPTVFIDEDGQAYLYWGNPNCYYVKLNKDMISYKGEIHAVPMKPEAFGRREGDPQRPTLYEEAPWLYKRKGMYYLFYAGGPVPEHLAYATAESPEGPWKYGGTLMATEGGSFTNHPGIADFRGKLICFITMLLFLVEVALLVLCVLGNLISSLMENSLHEDGERGCYEEFKTSLSVPEGGSGNNGMVRKDEERL